MSALLRVKNLAKAALGAIVYRSGLYRLWFRDRALIVLFHRVDDDIGENPISCGSDAFDAFCGFFKRYFDVISLGDLLDRLERSGPIAGKLVITFDDGYKDNLLVAGRTLRKHGLTASFFIATDFIGTERIGWWDEARGVTSRWMDWDDVRQMQELGFELAAHTKNHVNLGKISGEEAWAEIQGSRSALEAQLGRPVDLFSYPYGRARNIVEENRELVKRAGFRCCCSAYGGDVRADADPFDLRRIPISPWHTSPYQLGFELLRENGG